MKIRTLGGGWFGCSLALALKQDGHTVELQETGPRLFHGASGNNPARLHNGAHYPRSKETRDACRKHYADFMSCFGHLTRNVRTNIYAIAAEHSLVDFGTYCAILRPEIEFLTLHDPAEFGVRNIEGAIQLQERHIVIDEARAYFERELGDAVKLNSEPAKLVDDPEWDLTIDATFAANEGAGIDRYEPCLVLLMKGATDTAVTVMDGGFGSLYPWNEEAGLCSLSSAKFTPFSKQIRSYRLAKQVLDGLSVSQVARQGEMMIESMEHFYPAVRGFEVADHRLSIRAMPVSAADTRLARVERTGTRSIRCIAGKIDSIIKAADMVRAEIATIERERNPHGIRMQLCSES